ncbi:MAG: spore cortex-lytic enzyme [Clostridia bacterium]|nr:spore cortex-lytic enzyme [Clostridia bacterium]
MSNKIYLTSLLVFLVVLLVISNGFGEERVREALVIGDFGEDVKSIQEILIEMDYDDIKATGLFGLDTFYAIKSIQENNDLEVTGVVNEETISTLIQSELEEIEATQVLDITDNELTILAKIIYGEARGEPYQGQIAVGAVVINRVLHPSFPNTIAGVIYEPLAFTAVADGQFYLSPNQESFRAARDALVGMDPSDGALYYYNPAKATSKWIWSRPIIKRIGKHTFAR